MNTIYVVAATGGFEGPSFISATVLDDAEAQFAEWSETLIEEPGERVDLLEVVVNEDGTTKTSLLKSVGN